MNSIDAVRLRRFFRKHLVPAAERLRARGVVFFPTTTEPEADTWYVSVDAEEGEFVQLEVEDCEAALRDLWQRQELPELAGLAGPLMELAERLEEPREDDAEISPFVYVMY